MKPTKFQIYFADDYRLNDVVATGAGFLPQVKVSPTDVRSDFRKSGYSRSGDANDVGHLSDDVGEGNAVESIRFSTE